MRSFFFWRIWSWMFLGMAVVAQAAPAQDPAEEEFQRLATRFATAGKLDAVRVELAAFGRKFPGTPQAVKAAKLFGELPCPLDALQAKNIPELEKFDWHPKETVAVLGEHRGRQGGAVTSVLFSRNNKWLVSGSTNGYVRVWDPATMRLQHTFGHSQGAYCLAFSKDNRFLAHGGGDGQVRVWDMSAEKPKEKGYLRVASTPLFGLNFSNSGKWLIAGGSDSRVYLWDLSAEPQREHAALDGHTGAVRSVAFAPSGTLFASGGDDKMIKIFTISMQNQAKEKFSLEAHAGAVNSLAYHPTEENILVSGGADGLVKVWTVGTKMTQRTFHKGKNGAVNAVTISASGKTVAAAYADGTVRTFTLGTNTLVEKSVLEGHKMAATGVAFSPDGQNVGTGSSDWTVRLWPAVNAPKPRDKNIKVGHLSHVYTTKFSPDGAGLASGSYDYTARYWELNGAEPKERTPSMKADSYVYTLAFDPDGKTVAAGGGSAVFKTYEVANGRFVFGFPGHTSSITRLVWSPDGKLIASCSPDKTIRLWDPKTGKSDNLIKDFETYVNDVAFAPDGKRLLCSSGYYLYDDKGRIVVRNSETIYKDSTVRLYEAGTWKPLYKWANEKILMGPVSYTPDGQTVFFAGSDSLIRTLDAVKLPKEPDVFYKGGASGVSNIVCSPDGRWMACWGPDYRVQLFDLATGKKTKEWVLGEQYGSHAFSPDSRHLAVSVGTGVVLVLRLEEAKKGP